VTEIYDYMRLLFARVGTPYSPATGLPIEAQQVQDMVDRVMAMPEGTRAYLLAPIIRDRKGEYRKEFLDLRKQGFQRVKVDGSFHELEEPPTLDKKLRHDIDVVVDRIVVREGHGDAAGRQLPHRAGPGRRHRHSGNRPCRGRARAHHLQRKVRLPGVGLHHPEIEPRLFSFNAPFGACPVCDGLGVELFFRRTPCRARSGAALGRARSRPGQVEVPLLPADHRGAAKHYEFDRKKKWKDLPAHVQQVFLYGSAKRKSPSAMTRAAASIR
jgi:excinuclease ABC subunit A